MQACARRARPDAGSGWRVAGGAGRGRRGRVGCGPGRRGGRGAGAPQRWAAAAELRAPEPLSRAL